MKLKITLSLSLGISLTILLYGVLVLPAYAGGITVTTTDDTDATDGECSLREAIIAANTNASYKECTISGSPGDEIINLTTISGTITLTSNLPQISETLQFNGPTPDSLIINGNNLYNALESTGNGVNIGVDSLTIENVTSDGIYASSNVTVTNSSVTGANCGLFSQNGSAFVSSSQITGNGCDGINVLDTAVISGSTVQGAADGIYTENGNLTVTNTTVIAGDYGIRSGADVFVTNGTITTTQWDGVGAVQNVIVTLSQINAGYDGVYAHLGNATVTSSTVNAKNNGVFGEVNVIVDNSQVNANDDGIDANTGDAEIINSTIFGNESGIDTDVGNVNVTNSQVIGNEDGINAFGDVTVISSTITGNSLAGIQSTGSADISYSTIMNSGKDGINAHAINILQSTISGNGGDGIQSSNQSTITIDYSTIVNNSGYGINNALGTTTINHSIVAQNGGFGSSRDLNITPNGSNTYNLVGNGDTSGFTNGVDGNLVGSTDNLLDPKLGLLVDNGGNTRTHALTLFSPALDAIPGGSCAANIDQRGETRPVNTNCDMGAFEAPNDLGFYLYLPIVIK